MTPYERHQTGIKAEEQACAYLSEKGMQLLEKNYRCPFGELDLIMRDQEAIVFVEVRSRSSQQFGHPSLSINKAKQQKLIKTASFYLQKKYLIDKVSSRFDVITINFIAQKTQLEWFKNAFWPA